MFEYRVCVMLQGKQYFRKPFLSTCVKRLMNKLLLFEMIYLNSNKYF